jgi:hypothetical protein
VIQGTVTDLNGQPVSGVLLQPSGNCSPAITDTNGNYILGVPAGNDVTITASLNSLAFVPGMLAYTNVTASISNQNYLAVSTIAPTPSVQFGPSNITMTWFGIPGVTYQPCCSTNLVDWFPYGDALMGTNGSLQVVVPTASDPMRFYRVRASN